MKKIAVVFGVAAVATFTGCKDPDYKGRVAPQDEAKSIETTPVETTTMTTTVTTTEVKTVETKPIEVKPVEPKPLVDFKPPEPAYTVYIVQNGDYLAKISKKYNLTIKSIKELNGLKSDTIRVGQKLKLPGRVDVGVQTAPATTAKPAGSKKSYAPYSGATKEYVVKNGDTLGSIAYGNGINIRQLKDLNNLTGDTLRIGQKLKIPAEKVVAPKKAEEASKKVEMKKAEVEVKKAEVEVKKAEAEVKAAEAEVKVAEAEVKAAESAPAVPTSTYVVEEGDDLTRLAVDFGVTPAMIRELNNMGDGDTVKPGQVLKLPAEAQP